MYSVSNEIREIHQRGLGSDALAMQEFMEEQEAMFSPDNKSSYSFTEEKKDLPIHGIEPEDERAAFNAALLQKAGFYAEQEKKEETPADKLFSNFRYEDIASLKAVSLPADAPIINPMLKRSKSTLEGIQDWAKANLGATIAGTGIAIAGAFLLFHLYDKKKKTEEMNLEGTSRKNKSSGKGKKKGKAMAGTKRKDKDGYAKTLWNSSGQRMKLAGGIAAGIASQFIAKRFGLGSLLASIPLLLFGLHKKNYYATTAGVTMSFDAIAYALLKSNNKI